MVKLGHRKTEEMKEKNKSQNYERNETLKERLWGNGIDILAWEPIAILIDYFRKPWKRFPSEP